MIGPESLDARPAPGARRTFDSWAVGWRAVLLRGYAEPVETDDYDTSVTRDQKLVLVTKGSCRIERRKHGGWGAAEYRPGHVGLVPPGEAARLRWRGRQAHGNLQLHLPGALIEGVGRDLYGRGWRGSDRLDCLSMTDPVLAATVLGLEQAARAGAPDLHAETAAAFLASHLLLRCGRAGPRPAVASGTDGLARADALLHAHLCEPITLGALAHAAGMSRFRFLRAAKAHWGETPMRRLTRLRMEHAQRLLLARRLTIIEIALECGYDNPAHFATAFRRVAGVSPSAYRRML